MCFRSPLFSGAHSVHVQYCRTDTGRTTRVETIHADVGDCQFKPAHRLKVITIKVKLRLPLIFLSSRSSAFNMVFVRQKS